MPRVLKVGLVLCAGFVVLAAVGYAALFRLDVRLRLRPHRRRRIPAYE